MALTPSPSFAYPSNGWWAVRDTNGAIGVQKGSPGNNAIASVYIGAANSLNELGTNLAASLSSAIGKIGGTAVQQSALIDQLDQAAGKSSKTNYIYIGANATPGTNAGVSSNTSTANTGDAAASNIVPSPNLSGIDVAGIWQWLTTASNWVRIGEYVAGAVFIFIAVKELANR